MRIPTCLTNSDQNTGLKIATTQNTIRLSIEGLATTVTTHRPYWVGTAGTPPEDDGPISGDLDADVVVIGSGYTGLSCAIHLAKEHGIKATVLEANTVAWGCSTRNGGQAQISSGRLKRSQWIQRWGVDVAKKMHNEVVEAFDVFRDLIAQDDIDCDPQDGGHYYIAHKPKVMAKLEKESALLNDVFGYKSRIIRRDELHADHVRDQEAGGAMFEPDGTCIHAAKLAFGYIKMARRLGAKIHPASPVMGWKVVDGVHHLTTPGGTVRARAVALATAGYTPAGLSNRTKNRLMPILSELHRYASRLMTTKKRRAASRHARPSPTPAHCVTIIGICRTVVCKSAAAAQLRAAMRKTKSTWICCNKGCIGNSRHSPTSAWIIPGGGGLTSATT